MVVNFGHCPRCGSDIDHNRIIGGTIVCECGWSRSLKSDAANRHSMERVCTAIVLIGGLLIAGFIHAINWDQYFLTIIPLKIKQVAGIATVHDFERIGQICEERKKQDCVEEAWSQISRLQPGNLDNLARLGRLQLKREHWSQASATFSRYFTLKGKDIEAAYDYAQVLSHLRQYSEAGNYFKFAMTAKPVVLQISATRSYIQMLMTANRLSEAKSAILDYRHRSAAASMFMNNELKEIRTKLGEVQSTASAAQ